MHIEYMDRLKVSVCIATYNGEKYIKSQLESILSQLSVVDEVIISDDGSEDNTITIIKSLEDDRIQVYVNSKVKGVVGNFENALLHAKGDYIFLSDQDDIWEPNKVFIIKKELKYKMLVYTNAMVINQNGKIISNFFFKKEPKGSLLKNLLFNFYLGATMAFRKEVLDRALPFPAKIPMHDHWLGIIAQHYYSTKFIDIPLIRYRRHKHNASYCGGKSKNSFLTKIMFRINMLHAFITRIK